MVSGNRIAVRDATTVACSVFLPMAAVVASYLSV